MFKWEAGRQGTGYEKLKLFESKWLKADCYLLRYKPGSNAPYHRDPTVPGYEHHRINITLKRAWIGGDVWIEDRGHVLSRIFKFRPDIYDHAVSIVRAGTRYVLSIGWLQHGK